MTPTQLSNLLVELLATTGETEWVEWKHNNTDPGMIGETLSALSNSAALHRRETGYMVWGVEDGTKNVVGTTFQPRQVRKGNEELENWLMRSLHPQVQITIHEWNHHGCPMVLFEVTRATHAPVRFVSEEFVRVGSLKKKLKEYPTKEADLWASFAKTPFERGIAKPDLSGEEALAHLDYTGGFDLLKVQTPTDQKGVLARLVDEKLVVAKPGSRFDITNLGAVLLAKNLGQFDRLARKALRIIKYTGTGRTNTEREWRDAPALLTFGTVEAVRAGGFPEASFQATLNACAKQLPTPLVYLEATLAYKKEERRRHQTPSLFGDEPPPGELRAVKVIPNKAAQQEGFTIPTNMRVPAASVIRRLFDSDQACGDALEDLSQWESRGKSLEARAVVVEGRKVADRVFAIVQPVAGRGQKPLERRSSPLFSVVGDDSAESGVRAEGRQ